MIVSDLSSLLPVPGTNSNPLRLEETKTLYAALEAIKNELQLRESVISQTEDFDYNRAIAGDPIGFVCDNHLFPARIVFHAGNNQTAKVSDFMSIISEPICVIQIDINGTTVNTFYQKSNNELTGFGVKNQFSRVVMMKKPKT